MTLQLGDYSKLTDYYLHILLYKISNRRIIVMHVCRHVISSFSTSSIDSSEWKAWLILGLTCLSGIVCGINEIN